MTKPPPLWSQTATDLDILETPPPAGERTVAGEFTVTPTVRVREVPVWDEGDSRNWWFGDRPADPPGTVPEFWWWWLHEWAEVQARVTVIVSVAVLLAEAVS